MKIDISPLEKAYRQLLESLEFLHSEMALQDDRLRRQFCYSSIQCFENTYELLYKMLKRQLFEITSDPASIKLLNYADLIRMAAESGLVDDVQRFLEYKTMRNITSHTYNREKADLIISHLDDFQRDAQFVITQLKTRNDT